MGYLIDLLVVPLTMLSFFGSKMLMDLLNVSKIHFVLILFVLIHVVSSLIGMMSNYWYNGKLNVSMILIGFGPSVMGIITYLMVNLLPFLKWPFYWMKWLPNFDLWITPLIIGLMVFISQIILRKTVGETIMNIDNQIENMGMPLELDSRGQNSVILDGKKGEDKNFESNILDEKILDMKD